MVVKRKAREQCIIIVAVSAKCNSVGDTSLEFIQQMLDEAFAFYEDNLSEYYLVKELPEDSWEENVVLRSENFEFTRNSSSVTVRAI